MTREFKTVYCEAALEPTVSLREALPANHLARFVVDVVAERELTRIYERYGLRDGEAYAPEILLALFY
jgi:transposase